MDDKLLLEIIGGILVAMIAAWSAIQAQKAAAAASRTNTETASRLEAEKEAYERARKFDVETINRQDTEIQELREEVTKLKARIADLEKEVKHHESK
jgi:predicted RNase H-like nuclease (RuvC/YqgF family)